MKFNEFVNNFQYTNDGIGKNTAIGDVNEKELLVGIAVEMEHTSDLNKAASIAVDHLTENESYYSILVKSGLVDEEKALKLSSQFLNINNLNTTEKQAGVADVEGGEKSSDKELTDTLLGFKPHNVGDEIEDEEEVETEVPEENELGEQEDVFGRLGDILRPQKPEVTKHAMGVVLPDGENVGDKAEDVEEPKEEMPEGLYESQVKLAKETLSNRNVPTGLSKKEATQILVKHFIK